MALPQWILMGGSRNMTIFCQPWTSSDTSS